MKNQELEAKIKQDFENQAPDLLDRITTSCQAEKQQEPIFVPETKIKHGISFYLKRVALCVACLVLFVSGLSIGVLVKNSPTSNDSIDTHIYLDVNPSLELQLNSQNKVVSCNAGNNDAQAILAGLDLKGTDLNTALTAIVGSMYVNGYLSTSSNSILVSVNNENETKKEELLVDITKKINTVFEKSGMECSIIAQGFDMDDELLKRAQENGVSVGKMHLVDKMIEKMDRFEPNDRQSLSNMSIKELNLMYSEGKMDGTDPFHKDVSTGEIAGCISKDEAFSLLITELNLNIEELDGYSIRLELDLASPEKRMVYAIKIKLDGEMQEELYFVDCLTGELVDKLPPELPPQAPPQESPQEPPQEPKFQFPENKN